MTTEQIQIQHSYSEGIEDSLAELKKRLAKTNQEETKRLGEIIEEAVPDTSEPVVIKIPPGE